MRALALVVLACFVGPPHEELSLRDFVLEASARPRVPGSGGALATVELCAAQLERAGWDVERRETTVRRSIPLQQRFALYPGATDAGLLVERYEAYDPDAVPAWDLPPVYLGAPSGDARGPLLELTGDRSDVFERLAAMRVDPEGAVGLLTGEPPDAAFLDAAVEAGVVALLVAPVAPPADVAAWPAGPWSGPSAARDALRRATLAAGCPLPVAPVTAAEAAALRERLRSRRVRGEDGRALTLRIGPGPVEAVLTIEAEERALTATDVVATLPALANERPATILAASTDALLRDASRLLPIAAVLGAARELRDLGPRAAPVALVLALDPRALAAELAPEARVVAAEVEHAVATDLDLTAHDGFLLVDRFLDPRLERTARAARRLASEVVAQ